MDGHQPLISVIVPVYKGVRFLRAALGSLQAQTCSDWECICVDDESCDGSGLLADELASTDARIRVLHVPNGGTSVARNRGMELARGTYLAFLDEDDLLHPRLFETLVAAAEKTGADIVGCEFTPFEEEGAPDFSALPPGESQWKQADRRGIAAWAAKFYHGIPFEIWRNLYRRDVFAGHQFPPGVRVEQDLYWHYTLLGRCRRYVRIPWVGYGWRKTAAGGYLNPDPTSVVSFMKTYRTILETVPAALAMTEEEKVSLRDQVAWGLQQHVWAPVRNGLLLEGEVRRAFFREIKALSAAGADVRTTLTPSKRRRWTMFLLTGNARWVRGRVEERSSGPLFSVVVASYNYEKLVLETLGSLLAQTFRDFEIVVVDDGSADRSRENIRAFMVAHADSGISLRLFTHPEQKNRGLAATVRLGVEKCKGRYVAFCESDDLWTPDHLAEAAALVKRRPEAKIVVNDVEIFGAPERVGIFEKERALRRLAFKGERTRITPTRFRKLNYVLTFSCALVERKLLQACDWQVVGRPSALDWWLWRQLCVDNDIYFIDKKLTRWRMHDSYMNKVHAPAGIQQKRLEQLEELHTVLDGVIARQHPLSPVGWTLARTRRRMRGKMKAERPVYRLGWIRGVRFHWARMWGRVRDRDLIQRNAHARILVCLHLFYEEAWPLLADYLRNLSPYSVDLLVTCVKDGLSPECLASVRRFSPSVRVLELPNNGFDVGPFVESLRTVELARYDIVFKLQSKGVKRPFIYIYNQIFKRDDWFFNLFEGVLGGDVVHRAVDALLQGGARLVAAENLLVPDPKHKQTFVRDFCARMKVDFVEDYRFVAGTCFAVRADVLKPLQNLGLGSEDFAKTERGVFSLAHFIERWMCFAAAGHLKGMPVRHPLYAKEAARLAKTSPLRLLDDARFRLDPDFVYRVLEMRPVKSYEVVEVALGDIRRRWVDGRLFELSECSPYKYLEGDVAAYDAYCATNRSISGFEMSKERFNALRQTMENYDPLWMPVLSGMENVVIDGQHRCCILLKKFGPAKRIKVLRVHF